MWDITRLHFVLLQFNHTWSVVRGAAKLLTDKRMFTAQGDFTYTAAGFRQSLELNHTFPQVRDHYNSTVANSGHYSFSRDLWVDPTTVTLHHWPAVLLLSLCAVKIMHVLWVFLWSSCDLLSLRFNDNWVLSERQTINYFGSTISTSFLLT